MFPKRGTTSLRALCCVLDGHARPLFTASSCHRAITAWTHNTRDLACCTPSRPLWQGRCVPQLPCGAAARPLWPSGMSYNKSACALAAAAYLRTTASPSSVSQRRSVCLQFLADISSAPALIKTRYPPSCLCDLHNELRLYPHRYSSLCNSLSRLQGQSSQHERADKSGAPRAIRQEGHPALWCDFDKKWRNHTTEECYNCIKFIGG